MKRTTNQIVSTFRNTMKVETLIRVNNVTGTEFPVSGDAPLRQAWEQARFELKQQLNAEAAAIGARIYNPTGLAGKGY